MDRNINEKGFIMYWVCDDYRIPLRVFQIFPMFETWHVAAEHIIFITLHIYQKGCLYYLDNVFNMDDIRAVAEAIEAFTGEKFNDVVIMPFRYPTSVIYEPPLFIPRFRSKQHEVSYHRQRAKALQLELDAGSK